MYIPQTVIKSNLIYKIIQILKVNFPKLFKINTQGRPRKYHLGKILALVIYQARSSNLSFRKIVNFLKDDILSLKILGFKTIPDFTIIFKSYTKFLKNNMNIYLQIIGSQIYKNEKTFYLDSSSLVTSKLDKEAKFGKSTRLGWYSGYKLHLICNSKGIPISFGVTTANIHDSRCEYLIDSLSNIKPSADIIADKGYDVSRLLKYSNNLGINLICPINRRKAKTIELENIKDPLRASNYTYLQSGAGKIRYGKRWEIERLFGNLKENYSIDNHRVRGLSRKFFNVSLKLLLFTIEKAIAVLKIIQYFCNSLR
jgi:transposase